MILPAIQTIQSELNTIISAEAADIGEISFDGNHPPDKNIIISLIKIEENLIAANTINRPGSAVTRPAMQLDALLLFTAIKREAGYGGSLESLQKVIAFFHEKPLFTQANTPELDAGIDSLQLSLLTMSIEELQRVWSILGGKHHPCVAYKMRIATANTA